MNNRGNTTGSGIYRWIYPLLGIYVNARGNVSSFWLGIEHPAVETNLKITSRSLCHVTMPVTPSHIQTSAGPARTYYTVDGRVKRCICMYLSAFVCSRTTLPEVISLPLIMGIRDRTRSRCPSIWPGKYRSLRSRA